jgi:uncharacterized protein (DUF3084 family)
MVVLGGFLSYFGDLLGRRLGKKRVRLFGLRPKHTAILITSVTGSFIVFLSIISVMGAAKPIRDVLLRGETAIRENRKLLRELELRQQAFDARLRTAEAQAHTAENQSAEVSRKLTEARTQLTAAQSMAQRLQGDLQLGRANLSKIKSQSATLTAQNHQLVKKNVELDRQNDKYGSNNYELGKENLNLHRRQIELQKQVQQLNSESDILVKAKMELERQEAKLKESSARLNLENAAFQRANEVLQRANRELNEANIVEEHKARLKIAALEEKIASLGRFQERLVAYLNGADNAVQQYVALRSKRICIPSGEIVARKVLGSEMSERDLRKELRALIGEAEAVTTLKGAGKGSNNRSISLLSPSNLTRTLQDTEVLEEVVQEIRRAKGQQQIIATTLTNTLEGEQVPIFFNMEPVRTTFRKGAVVATKVIPVVRSLDTMVTELVQFLQQDVRNAAILAGTIPSTDGNSGSREVGVMSPAELVDLVDRMRRMGGEVQVSAVAADDLSSSEPLRLSFRLSRPRTKS